MINDKTFRETIAICPVGLEFWKWRAAPFRMRLDKSKKPAGVYFQPYCPTHKVDCEQRTIKIATE